MMKNVLVAMSGGVDSSAAAELLLQQGYQVAGLVMMMSDSHIGAVEAAKKSADKLGIPIYVLDLRSEFKSEIIDYFASEYLNGRTPNPCVRCNPRIKFKYLLKTAEDKGFDRIATGHYAKIVESDGIYKLCCSDSGGKDQSYMLAGLTQCELSRLIFPLSGLKKQEVRIIAKNAGLECFDAPDSQENCFIPDGEYADFIEKNYRFSPVGEFVSPDGRILGQHKGIIHYTVGQRKGLNISLGRPAYVSDIDPATNKITLSFEKRLANRVFLSDFSEVYPGAVKNSLEYLCKLRSTGRLIRCVADKSEYGVVLDLLSPEPVVPCGQAGVLYSGCEVLGTGTIEKME